MLILKIIGIIAIFIAVLMFVLIFAADKLEERLMKHRKEAENDGTRKNL